MDDTGRIVGGLSPMVCRICFGPPEDTVDDDELWAMTQADRAHVVMLAERGLLARDAASSLLRGINRLRAEGFAPLRGRPGSRGLYLKYEDFLIEVLGPGVGGNLQMARSRNDLNATVLRLRLRNPYRDLLRDLLRLWAVLLGRARRHATVVMPAYTHYQAAVPITYGHYLVGIATAIGRDVAGLVEAGADLGRCPLGAGAVGGTALPIEPASTARRLGFERPVLHSIDAVASRDFVLRILSAAAILGVTLSRLSADLLLWTTAEFGFLELPDRLVGSSSMMPQKRNPFPLEHLKGRTATSLGAFAAAVTAMHAAPFSNSIAVGSEAVAQVWKPLRDLCGAAILARLIIAAARPQTQAMLHRADEGYACATALADRLVLEAGLPFREAHHAVGTMVRTAIAHGHEPLPAAARRWIAERSSGPEPTLNGLDPVSVARAADFGGGPGPASFRAALEASRFDRAAQVRRLRQQVRAWRAADAELDAAVRRLAEPQAATPSGEPSAFRSPFQGHNRLGDFDENDS